MEEWCFFFQLKGGYALVLSLSLAEALVHARGFRSWQPLALVSVVACFISML